MSRSENTVKRRGFTYVKAPNHALDELSKLNGLDFKGKNIIIEKEITSPKTKPVDGINKQTHEPTFS